MNIRNYLLNVLIMCVPVLSFSDTIVAIPSGTSVAVRALNVINPQNFKTGDSVEFKVVSDVKIDNTVVISSGSQASGTVTASEVPGIIGKPGKISIALNRITAVDGSFVPVQATRHSEGEDKQSTTLIMGLICLPLILTEGGDTQIAQGVTIEAFTVGKSEVTISE
jgi:hypothetical protein